MIDLSALTAETGHEFAMFTLKGERLIVRGNEKGHDTVRKISKQV